jgi:hypothetical protein
MPPVLEPVLVSEHRQHTFQSLVGELHDAAAPLANEVLVIGLSRHWLVPLEPLAEFVGPHQAAFHHEVQRAVHGGHSYPLTPVLELAPDPLDREMILRKEHDLCNEVPLASDGLMVLSEMSAKSLEKGRSFGLIQARHRREHRPKGGKRTTPAGAPR